MNEEKKPAPAEKSLSYIAWSLKDLVTEIKKLNETLAQNAKKDPF